MKLFEIFGDGPLNRTETIKKADAVSLINKHCSEIVDAYKTKEKYIFRGNRKAGNMFMRGSSSSANRVSANTDNYVTMLMDNSDNWKQFPKRGKSFICSSDYTTARAYGYPYLVFPFNGTVIAQCPSADIWGAFEDPPIWGIHIFNEHLRTLMYAYTRKELDNENPVKFKKEIADLQKLIANEDPVVAISRNSDGMYAEFTEDVIPLCKKTKDENGLYKYFESLFTSERFDLMDTKTYGQKSMKEKETWFAGEAIFVLNKVNDGISSMYRFIEEL